MDAVTTIFVCEMVTAAIAIVLLCLWVYAEGKRAEYQRLYEDAQAALQSMCDTMDQIEALTKRKDKPK